LNNHDTNVLKGEFLCNQCKSNFIIDPKLSNINPNRSRNSSRIDSNQQAPQVHREFNGNSKQPLINFEVIDNESALKTLIRLAKIMNPRQMKLPKNIKNTFEIPGLSKIEWWTKEGNKLLEQKESLKKKDVKDNFVSIPRKTCFVCRKYVKAKK
jgi:hypothetical protein